MGKSINLLVYKRKMKFEKDLAEGRKIERLFARKLIGNKNLLWIRFAPNRLFKEWDMEIGFLKEGKEQEKTFEVKDDIKSEETGNICFEYQCSGMPSGIFASKADYIVYYISGLFYYQERGELLIRLNEIEKEKRYGGDYNNAKMFIVKKEHLGKLFKIYH